MIYFVDATHTDEENCFLERNIGKDRSRNLGLKVLSFRLAVVQILLPPTEMFPPLFLPAA